MSGLMGLTVSTPQTTLIQIPCALLWTDTYPATMSLWTGGERAAC